MKYLASEYNVGYPLHGAKFLNDSILLVTGGGGQLNTDIPNKLTALKVDFNKKKVIKRFREITLDSTDDCPTTLDAAVVHGQGPLSNVILMGCNETTSGPTGSPNHHLRKFTYENNHLKFIASADFNRSNDPSEYNKLTSLSSDGSVAAIASSKLPTVIRIIDPLKMEEKYEIETGNEVKDLNFSPDGKVISYITETTLEVISIVTGRFIIRKTDFNKQISLSKVRFLTNDVVAIAGVVNNKSRDLTISTINIKTKNTKVILSKAISSSYAGITAMDASKDGQLISLATNENSLLIIKSKDLSVTRSFKKVHQGDITKVVFSPNSEYIASVSTADTIHVVKLPPGLAESTSFFHKLFKLLINILLTLGVIGVAYVAYYFDLHTKSYHYINDKYLTKRDTSQYFQMNDGAIETSTEILDDIVSVHTLTRDVNTESEIDTKELFSSSSAITALTNVETLSTASLIEEIKTISIYEESLSSTLIDISSSIKSEIISTVDEVSSPTFSVIEVASSISSIVETVSSDSPDIVATPSASSDVEITSSVTYSATSSDVQTSIDTASNEVISSETTTSEFVTTESTSTESVSIQATSTDITATSSITSSASSLISCSATSSVTSSDVSKSISVLSLTVASNETDGSKLTKSTQQSIEESNIIESTAIESSLSATSSPKISVVKSSSENGLSSLDGILSVSSQQEESSKTSIETAKSIINESDGQSKSQITDTTKLSETIQTDVKITTPILERRGNYKAEQTKGPAKRIITVDGVVYEVVAVSSASTKSSSELTVSTSTLNVSHSSNVSDDSTSSKTSVKSVKTSIESNATILESSTTLVLDSKTTIEDATSTISSTKLLSSTLSTVSDVIKPLFSTVVAEESVTVLSSFDNEEPGTVSSSIVSSEKSTLGNENSTDVKHRHIGPLSLASVNGTIIATPTITDETTPIISKSYESIFSTISDKNISETKAAGLTNTLTKSPVHVQVEETAVSTKLAEFAGFEISDNNVTETSMIRSATNFENVTSIDSTDYEVSHEETQTIDETSSTSFLIAAIETTEPKYASSLPSEIEAPSSVTLSSVREKILSSIVLIKETEISSRSAKKPSETEREEEGSTSLSVHSSHVHKSTSIIEVETPILTTIQVPTTSATETVADIKHDEL